MKSKDLIKTAEKGQVRKGRRIFNIGDTTAVHVKIKEGEKERIQIFTGTVIARKGSGPRESFTVRRLVGHQGVERTFPLNSPFIERIDVTRRGRVRRAKLYYLRDRIGKATRVTEKRGTKLASTKDTPKAKEVKPKAAAAKKSGK